MKIETQPELEPIVTEKPVEEKPKPKKKVVKKVKKDDDDYIQKLINMEIPKTELEVFEKLEFEEPKKKPKRKSLVPSTSVEKEASPELIVEELPEETVIVQLPMENGDVVEQKVTKRKIKKKQGEQEQIIEIKTVEQEGKEPETEVTIEEPLPVEQAKPIEEEQPGDKIQPVAIVQVVPESVPIEEVQPIDSQIVEQPKQKKKKAKKPKKDDEDEYIKKLIEQDIPKTELETFEKPEFEEPKKKLKKKHSLVSKTSTEDESITEHVTEDLPEKTLQLKLPKKDTADETVIPEDEVNVKTKKYRKLVNFHTEIRKRYLIFIFIKMKVDTRDTL